MYGTVEPRLITLLNDTSSDAPSGCPRLCLPSLHDPYILNDTGRSLVLEPSSSQNLEEIVLTAQNETLPYTVDAANARNELLSRSATVNTSALIGSSLTATTSQSLRKILADDCDISQASKKRQRYDDRKDDFVQLPQPAKKPKAVKQVVPPIIIGIHELPPNQAALFPPIASSSFHDSHGRNTLNIASATDTQEAFQSLNQSDGTKQLRVVEDKQVINTSKPSLRARKKWTDEETKQLLLGVQKHGIGNWKKISEDEDFTFNGRTAVHIKDRFRTCFPDGFKNQVDSMTVIIPNTTKCASHLGDEAVQNLLDATIRQDTTITCRDEAIERGAVPAMGMTPLKKSRSHRKNFEDLMEIGIVGFSKCNRRERRPFSEEEDRNILIGLETYGQSWTLIQRDPKLGLQSRKPTDIRDRFRNRHRDKDSRTENGKRLQQAVSTHASEVQSRHSAMMPWNEVSFGQERDLGPSQTPSESVDTCKNSLQHAAFSFRGSYTDLLGPLPVSDAPDSFSSTSAFDWQDTTTSFSSSIGEMDISRLLLEEIERLPLK